MNIRNIYLWILILWLILGCGKDLSQMFFHSSTSQRFKESTSGQVPIPSPAILTNENSFNFAVFGDIHIDSQNNNLLSRFKAEVSANNISFFVILGDLTEDGTNDEYDHVKADLNEVGIPYYAAIGNHDLFQTDQKGGWAKWKSTFGAATYSVTLAKKVRFLFIDTSTGEVGAEQMEWLRNQLSTFVPYTFVGSHYSIYDGETPTMWRLESLEERYKLINILNQGGVYAYTGAHAHGFHQSKLGNVLHFITGSMYHGDLDFGKHGYLLFKYENNDMTWQQVLFQDFP